MSDKKTSWPLVVGLTAGIVGALAATAVIYAIKQEEPDAQIRDAKDIIAQCHDQIKEIEESLQRLREPAA